MQHVAAYERLAAEAAVTRDHVTARKALLAHVALYMVAFIPALVWIGTQTSAWRAVAAALRS